MLQENHIYRVTITGTTSDGDGVCRIGQMAVFVPGACEGDEAEIQITKIKPRYAFARLMRILMPSAHRQKPPCAVYERCGGCQLLHINYEKQLELKKQFVSDALTRLGHLDLSEVSFYDTIGMEPPLRYRNKMVFPVGRKADGRMTGGFYAAKSHHIIALSDCLLGDSYASGCLSVLLAYMKENDVPPYDETLHTGLVRRLFIRTALHSREAMAVISTNSRSLPHEERLIRALCSVPSSGWMLKSIILNINTGKNNLVLGQENRTLYGADSICDTLCGLTFDISPNSFYQVNPVQTEKLYEAAVRFAGLTGSETVLDLYCGIGTISLCAAKKAARVIGVEIVPQAISDAKENAVRNGIINAEFYTGDAEEISQKLLDEGLSPDVVFLDPPRKGSDRQTLDAILAMSPERIVYVSCNPATLARDLQTLTSGGYALRAVQPVDMFPHTKHVECVVLMSRVSK